MPMNVFVGHKFGMLTVQGFEQRQGKNQKVWYAKCRCDCGSEKWILWYNITSGRSQSCGCKTYENAAISRRKSRDRWFATRSEEIFTYYDENPHLTVRDVGIVFGITYQRVQQCVVLHDPDKTQKQRFEERKSRVNKMIQERHQLLEENKNLLSQIALYECGTRRVAS